MHGLQYRLSFHLRRENSTELGKMADVPTLGYWLTYRGFGEQIRCLLHYRCVKFNDKRYPNFEEWQKEKFNLGLDFPNLPYYFDGDVKISQSVAIMRHLARKYQLDGQTEAEKARLEMVEQQLIDFRTTIIKLFFSETFESEKSGFLKNVPAQLRQFDSCLGDRKFFVGDRITYVDFMAYDIFDYYRLFSPTLYDDFPRLSKYQERIRALPELQAYMTSSAYVRWPIFGATSKFGSINQAKPKHA